MKGFTLFSGIEGVGCGMKAAGVQHVGGLELDDKIASAARTNGFDVATADVLTACPDNFPDTDWLHASPPCPNFSNAKTDAQETEQDIALAHAVANWIIKKRPLFFTLENVYQYRESQSWGIIARALLEHGFSQNYWHCNMADWGVPQTRKRMFVIARRDGRLPMLPPATHAENPQVGLFGTLLPWVGWYEAIEDIFSRKTKLNLTQKRLDKAIRVSGLKLIDLQSIGFAEERLTARDPDEPCFTVTADKSLSEYTVKNGKYFASDISFITRFQSFPDWYKLPEQKSLACKGIGNAVPPLFIQRVAESLI